MDSVVGECIVTSIGTKVTHYVGEGTKDQRYNEHFASNRVDDCNY